MTSHYELDGDELIQVGEECQSCGSQDTEYRSDFGYWKCENCSTVWGHDEDDPDYDELLCERCDLYALPIYYAGGVCFACLQREGKLGGLQ